MQIHELDTFVGNLTDTEYLAVDDGTETNKITPMFIGNYLSDRYVDLTTPKYALNTSASSGDDYDLNQAIVANGWQSVVSDNMLTLKELLTLILQRVCIQTKTVTGTTNAQGAISLSLNTSAIVLSVGSQSDTSSLCIPWIYNNSTWFATLCTWQSSPLVTRGGIDVTLTVRYIEV